MLFSSPTVIRLDLCRDGETVPAVVARATPNDIDVNPGVFLHSRECAEYANYPFERRQRTYLLGRVAGKRAAGDMLGTDDYSNLEIRRGAFTQPVLVHNSEPPTAVSIAHVDDMAVALAFPQLHPMGIDIETIDDEREAALRSQMTPAEIKRVQSAISGVAGLSLLWSMKEALSKALRTGLTVPFSLLEVTDIEPNELNGYTARFTNFGQYRAHAWLTSQVTVAIVLPKHTTLQTSLAALIASDH